jgi:hypothetical protein
VGELIYKGSTDDPEDVADFEVIIQRARARQGEGSALSIENGGQSAENGGQLTEKAQELVSEVWDRCGEDSRRRLKGMANFESQCTLQELADHLDEPVEAVKRWRYSAISRPLNWFERERPDLPRLFEQDWIEDEGHNVYWMEPAVREAVLSQPN